MTRILDMSKKQNKLLRHEALDRCHVILCTIEDHLQGHPFVTRNPEINLLVDQAITALACAYQKIGAKK